eukprot:11934331-Alexandrium_andersonii.AAC.1
MSLARPSAPTEEPHPLAPLLSRPTPRPGGAHGRTRAREYSLGQAGPSRGIALRRRPPAGSEPASCA